jgi:hypothetical protein
MKRRTGANTIPQVQHLDSGGSQKVTQALAVGKLLDADITASTKVGRFSLLRVRVTASTILAFSEDKAALDAETVDATTGDDFYVIELNIAGTYEIACPADWVKASVNPARKELVRE